MDDVAGGIDADLAIPSWLQRRMDADEEHSDFGIGFVLEGESEPALFRKLFVLAHRIHATRAPASSQFTKSGPRPTYDWYRPDLGSPPC